MELSWKRKKVARNPAWTVKECMDYLCVTPSKWRLIVDKYGLEKQDNLRCRVGNKHYYDSEEIKRIKAKENQK